MKKYILSVIVLILLSSFCLMAGCVNLNKKYIAQQKYGLSVNLPQPGKYKNNKILEIYYPEIALPFSGTNFVYRIHKLKYATDYYNTFFISPLEQVYQNELKYLQATKLFKYASSNVAPLQADYILKTYISELYADYQDKALPKAVLSIQFVLLDQSAQPPKIVLQKTFIRSKELTQKSSDALVASWNNELSGILRQLVGGMQKVVSSGNRSVSIKKSGHNRLS